MWGNIHAVLFDLDGTLIDSAPDLGAAADKMRIDRGLPSLPYEKYRPKAGAGARGMLGVGFGLKPDSPEFAQMREEFFCNYEQRLTHSTYAFDGVAQLIDALELQGIPWGVVTNKSKRFTEPLAQQMPLLFGAQAIVSGDTTPHSKPHPAPLLEAATRMQADPGTCVYVGDDERDVIAGKAAGMKTVAACYGYLGSGADVDAWNADAKINSPLELLKLLGRG